MRLWNRLYPSPTSLPEPPYWHGYDSLPASTGRNVKIQKTAKEMIVSPSLLSANFGNLQADGSVLVPKALQPYMGGKERLVPLH